MHPSSVVDQQEMAIDLACETVYRFFGALLSDPRSDASQLLFDPHSRSLLEQAVELLRDEFAHSEQCLGFGELPVEDLHARTMLDAIKSPCGLCDEYTRVFGLVVCRECPPYETEYHSMDETFFRSQRMADVAGFYRAFGLEPASFQRERPDHIGLELEFESFLLMKKRQAEEAAARDCGPGATNEQAALCQAARESFFRDHIIWWVPSFTVGLRRKAERGIYAAAGRSLAAFLALDRVRLRIPAPQLPLEAEFIESPEECDGCLLHSARS
jgi:TorA maturation chaperone TorD